MNHPHPTPDRAATIHRWITRALQLIMLFALAGAVYERQWLNAAAVAGIFGIIALPGAVSRRMRVYVPPEFELLAVVFLFASLFLGEVGGYYERFWWWDVLLHTGSGLLLGILGFLLVYVLNGQPRIEVHLTPAFVAVFALAFAVAIGAVWEIFEFAMDSLFGLNMQKSGLVDTMWDLIVDTLGALIVSGIGYVYMRQGTDSFVERGIQRFVEGNPRLFRSRTS